MSLCSSQTLPLFVNVDWECLHRSCSSANPPSYYDDNCRLLAQNLQPSEPSEYYSNSENEAEIIDTNGQLITKCFAQFPGATGW